MKCFIGVDIGTSAIKCLLISEKGQILSSSKQRNNNFIDNQGRVEFDAVERYNTICTLIKKLLHYLPPNFKIVSISIVGASGNALLLDGEKKPIINAIGWQDERAKSFVYTSLFPFTSEYIYDICGWSMSIGFPLAIFAWMKLNMSEIYFSAEFFSTDFVYYNHRLSGNWVIDRSTASNFYLVDQVQMEYHQPFLDYLQIKKGTLPQIIRSGQPIGMITKQASNETGLPEGTVVVAGAFDHPSSARGTGMINEGDLLISCGTSWVGFFPVKTREQIMKKNMLIDSFLSPEHTWGGMFSFTSVGEFINGYINLLFNDSVNRFEKFETAAIKALRKENKFSFDVMQKEVSQEKYLEKLLCRYSIPEICLSILDSIADLICEKINKYKESGITVKNVTIVGGFSEMHVWTTILRKKLGIPICLVRYGEYSGCFGAAILAGMGVRIFDNEFDGFTKMNLESMIYR